MEDRDGIFAGDDPFAIARRWLAEAEASEAEDPNAMALATVDAAGMPNVRMVLLKAIEETGFVFYTNHDSAKGRELAATGKAAFVLHWKSLRRQIRVRGTVEAVESNISDSYYRSRALQSRLGAWASPQSRPLASRAALAAEMERAATLYGEDPSRPPHWGGCLITPVEIEFWADGAFRLHDRFRWTRALEGEAGWKIARLAP